MYASNAYVDPKHQRLGITSAMYQLTEQITVKLSYQLPNKTENAKAL